MNIDIFHDCDVANISEFISSNISMLLQLKFIVWEWSWFSRGNSLQQATAMMTSCFDDTVAF